MKKGFTLVEMLIVVTVMITLMTMVFRLGSIGGDSYSRTLTVERMQRLENAVSGYYAAFGSYPPVKVHGSRNPFLAVNDHGMQNTDGTENTDIWGWLSQDGEKVTNWSREGQAWKQVEAACRSQPVDCEFPFPANMAPLVTAKSAELQMWASESSTMSDDMRKVLSQPFDDGVSSNPRRFAKDGGDKSSDWRDVQLFKFGLLSFLLPRYLVMTQFDTDNGDYFFGYEQWKANNSIPCDPMTGNKFASWARLQEDSQSTQPSVSAKVANIPSQAACARWMASFENALSCNYDLVLYGVHVRSGTGGSSLPSWDEVSGTLSGDIRRPGRSDSDSTEGQYVLDKVSMQDGWGRDLYYYSPAPHQTYIIWSAGPNGRTFPPWISRDGLSQDGVNCTAYWVRDDMVSLSN